jgi:hypothetical protein
LVDHIAGDLQRWGRRLQHHPQQRNVDKAHRRERGQGHTFLLQHGFRLWVKHRRRFFSERARGLWAIHWLSLIRGNRVVTKDKR